MQSRAPHHSFSRKRSNTKMNYLRSIFVVLLLIFAVPAIGQVEVRDGCTVPEALAGRTNVHQCADCTFRSRSPFDSRNDGQRCGEEALPTVGPGDTNEFTTLFGKAPQARGTNLRGIKLRAARQRYAERRENWGGVFLSGDDDALFYIKDGGEVIPASAASDPSATTELKIPGLDVEGLVLYSADTRSMVDNIYETWGLGTPVLWVEYNSYVRDRVNGGFKPGTAIKLALPDAPLPLFLDGWAYMSFTVPHLKVAEAHIKLMSKCVFPDKIHTFVPPDAVRKARENCP